MIGVLVLSICFWAGFHFHDPSINQDWPEQVQKKTWDD
jgi:hypothetical protein